MAAAGRPHVGQGWSCQKWLLLPLEFVMSGLHPSGMRIPWVGGGVLWCESCECCCAQFGCHGLPTSTDQTLRRSWERS